MGKEKKDIAEDNDPTLVLFYLGDLPKLGYLIGKSEDQTTATVQLGETQLDVSCDDISTDEDVIEHFQRVEKIRKRIQEGYDIIMADSPEQVKTKILDAGHINVIEGFEDPEEIVVAELNNISNLIPSIPNHPVIIALREREKWDKDVEYNPPEGTHNAHVNLIAAVAFPEAFFSQDDGDE